MQVSFQTISKWENGVNMPDITHIPRLMDVFGVSADVLLGFGQMEKQDWRRFDDIAYWNGNRKLFAVWKSLYWNEDYFDSAESFAVKTSGLYFVYAIHGGFNLAPSD